MNIRYFGQEIHQRYGHIRCTCCILVLHNVEFASTVRVYVYTACTVLWLGNSLLAAFWYCTYIELAIAAHVYVHTAQTVVWADHPGAPAFL